MKTSVLYTIAAVSVLLINTNVLAQDSKDKTPEWEGNIQFGYIASSGNTENSNINGKFNIKRDDRYWIHDFNAAYYRSSEAEVTSAERFKLVYQADYKLNVENTYWFINSSYEDDRFSGFEYRATISTGYGSRLYNDNDMTLDAEIGAGMRSSEEIDALTNTSITQNEALIRFASKYLWKIEKDRSLAAAISVEEGEEVRVSNFEIGFTTLIAGGISMKAGYEARHVSEVPEGKEKLDTIVSLNLLYNF